GKVIWKNNATLRLLKMHGSIDWIGDFENFITVRDSTKENRGEPVLIFGGGNKLTAKGPFLQLLNEFEKSLATSKRLIVIGYSFRDEHVNAVISRWMLRGKKGKMFVIDPAPAVSALKLNLDNSPIIGKPKS